MWPNQNPGTRKRTYLKDAPNGIFSKLESPLTDDLPSVNGADKAFEEALGDLLIVEGVILGLGTFAQVTRSTRPLGNHKPRGKRRRP